MCIRDRLSGESLAGNLGHGIDFDTVLKMCAPIKTCSDMGVQIGIVAVSYTHLQAGQFPV